jgi:trehalose-6-phosphate synthase
LHSALTMNAAERHRRAEGLAAQVRTHDLAAWTRAQLADFDRAAASRASRNVQP